MQTLQKELVYVCVTSGARRLVQGVEGENDVSLLQVPRVSSCECTYTTTLMEYSGQGGKGWICSKLEKSWEPCVLFVRTVGEKSVFPASNHSRAGGTIT